MKKDDNSKHKDTAEDMAYNKIKVAINKRYIKRGSQLVETALARQLKVSRTPVRGAIRRLVYEGYVEFHPKKGAFVIEPSFIGIKQNFAVRAQLEKMAAAEAAKYITKKQIKELYRLIDKEDKLFEARQFEEYWQTNDTIHLLIAEASGNPVLLHYVKDLLNRTKIYLILFDPFYKLAINPSVSEHLEIVKQLEKGDSKKVEKLVQKHLDSAFGEMEIDEKDLIPEDYLAL
jgi:DNA-binding GntR family transcriptional regulator